MRVSHRLRRTITSERIIFSRCALLSPRAISSALVMGCSDKHVTQRHRVPPSVMLDSARQRGWVGIDAAKLKFQAIGKRYHLTRPSDDGLAKIANVIGPIGDNHGLTITIHEIHDLLGKWRSHICLDRALMIEWHDVLQHPAVPMLIAVMRRDPVHAFAILPNKSEAEKLTTEAIELGVEVISHSPLSRPKARRPR